MIGMSSLLAIGAAPLVIAMLIVALKKAGNSFYVMFLLQFVIILASSLVDIKMSVAALGSMILSVALLLILSSTERADWRKSRNGMLLLYGIWGGYCILEIANPNTVMEAWTIACVNYFVFPLVCAILAPFALKNIKSIQWLLVIWSLFILVAAFKGYWQKSHGFNSRELEFLYVYGGAKTHLIWSGIRYFSCFTDAANFGVHMSLAMTTFGISIFYVKKARLKIYFAIVAVAAAYGMFISGTRAAIIIPFVATFMFAVLSGSKKALGFGLSSFVLVLFFFAATNIGNSNQYVRKMRSAFRPTADASYQVRVVNRERIAELMANKPFGYGIGLSKGERFNPKERMPYPPDSWLIAIWVETGIIGLVLYLTINIILFVWCSWILMCKIRNKQLRGLLAAWLCASAGFFVAAYVNDVMQYPTAIIIYTSFILCLLGPYMDQQEKKESKTIKAI